MRSEITDDNYLECLNDAISSCLNLTPSCVKNLLQRMFLCDQNSTSTNRSIQKGYIEDHITEGVPGLGLLGILFIMYPSTTNPHHDQVERGGE